MLLKSVTWHNFSVNLPLPVDQEPVNNQSQRKAIFQIQYIQLYTVQGSFLSKIRKLKSRSKFKVSLKGKITLLFFPLLVYRPVSIANEIQTERYNGTKGSERRSKIADSRFTSLWWFLNLNQLVFRASRGWGSNAVVKE